MVFIRQGGKLVRTKDLRHDVYKPLVFQDNAPNPEREARYREHSKRIRFDISKTYNTI